MATATTTTTKTTATATITNTTATAATTVTATTATVTVKQHQTSLEKYNSHFISLHLATTVLSFSFCMTLSITFDVYIFQSHLKLYGRE